MTAGEWAELGYLVVGWPYVLWVWLAPRFLGQFLPDNRAGDAARTAWIECKPFALPTVAFWYLCRVYGDWAAGRGGFNGRATFVLLVGVITWWLVRHDGDDRWRRRRRAVAARIRVTAAGRLAIDPGGAR